MPTAAGMYYGLEPGGPAEQPPLILIHDAGGSHRMWPAAIRRLPGWQVLALDLPGHGNSGGTGQQSAAAYARAVLDLLVELNISQAVFAGHGLGAGVALYLAANEPEWTAGAVSLAGGACLSLPPDLCDLFKNADTLPLALSLLGARLQPPGTHPSSPLSPAADAWLKQMKAVRPGVLMGDWRAAAGLDLRPDAYRITVPVLVVAGMDDRLVPLAASQFLAGQLPQARLQLVPDAGHLLLAEQTGIVAAALLEFLNTLKPEHLRLDEGLPVTSYERRIKRTR